jgi:hypothetical protein
MGVQAAEVFGKTFGVVGTKTAVHHEDFGRIGWQTLQKLNGFSQGSDLRRRNVTGRRPRKGFALTDNRTRSRCEIETTSLGRRADGKPYFSIERLAEQ